MMIKRKTSKYEIISRTALGVILCSAVLLFFSFPLTLLSRTSAQSDTPLFTLYGGTQSYGSYTYESEGEHLFGWGFTAEVEIVLLNGGILGDTLKVAFSTSDGGASLCLFVTSDNRGGFKSLLTFSSEHGDLELFSVETGARFKFFVSETNGGNVTAKLYSDGKESVASFSITEADSERTAVLTFSIDQRGGEPAVAVIKSIEASNVAVPSDGGEQPSNADKEPPADLEGDGGVLDDGDVSDENDLPDGGDVSDENDLPDDGGVPDGGDIIGNDGVNVDGEGEDAINGLGKDDSEISEYSAERQSVGYRAEARSDGLVYRLPLAVRAVLAVILIGTFSAYLFGLFVKSDGKGNTKT